MSVETLPPATVRTPRFREQVVFSATREATKPHESHPVLITGLRHSSAALKLLRLERHLNGNTDDDGSIKADPIKIGDATYHLSGMFRKDPENENFSSISVSLGRGDADLGTVTAEYGPRGLMHSIELQDSSGMPVFEPQQQAKFGKLLRTVASTIMH